MKPLRMPKAFTDKERPAVLATAPVAPAAVSVQDIHRSAEPATEFKDTPNTSTIDTSWLPWAAKTYHISPNLEDYVFKNMPICPSDVPNRNGIGFPLQELLRYQPPPIARQVYRAWTGCPVHYEHDNEDCTKALGVIFDTSLRQIKTHGNGKIYMVHGLIGVDKRKYPVLAGRLLDGSLNTGSMGALSDMFTCSVCGSSVTKETLLGCGHVEGPNNVNWRMVHHEGKNKIAYLNAFNLSPIEYSLVEDPAWTTCQNFETLDQ